MTAEPKTLYHYCRNEVFQSIVSKREIWLSSLRQSNDSYEGKLLSSLLSDVSDRLSATPMAIQAISSGFASVEKSVGALGICLSSDGDVLSQWRAYAGDGSGVSIGFNRDFLEWLRMQIDLQSNVPPYDAARLESVIYKPELQLEALLEKIAVAKSISENDWKLYESRDMTKDGPQSEPWLKINEFMERLAEVLYRLKGLAFEEEREWRLYLPYISWFRANKTEYRAAGNQIVPYKVAALKRQEGVRIIDHIYLGPKHATPKEVIENFLERHEFFGVDVRKSAASYR